MHFNGCKRMSAAPPRPAPDRPAADLGHAWRRVCENDPCPSYRDLEAHLYPVARAILAGWRPPLGGLAGIPAARAGYLIDLLRGWMPAPPARAWTAPLDELAARADLGSRAPFFHRDPPGPGNDDIAARWGLSRGINVSRLRQSLESPYVV